MDDFIAVQHLINNAKYGNKGILPELQVVHEGALKGFVSINPRWAGFRDVDYEVASESVCNSEEFNSPEPKQIEVKSGDFDLRGFEIARSQFFDSIEKICVTFSIKSVKFSKACLQKLGNVQFIEMLVHPAEHLVAVRPAAKDDRNAIRWGKSDEKDGCEPRIITGVAFLRTVYSLFGWEEEYRYRIQGVRRHKNMESVILFDMKETEVFMPRETLLAGSVAEGRELLDNDVRPVVPNTRSSIRAYPSAWADTFGSNYYRHAQARELSTIDIDGAWQITEKAQPFSNTELNITPPEELAKGIRRIIEEKKRGRKTDGPVHT